VTATAGGKATTKSGDQATSTTDGKKGAHNTG
jgi:hypothetical protein